MIHTEAFGEDLIVTEYGGFQNEELHRWNFKRIEDGDNRFKVYRHSPPGADSRYPVKEVPDYIVEAAEDREDVEIVEREIPIRSARCTECGMLGAVEAEERGDVKRKECPMCGKETDWNTDTR